MKNKTLILNQSKTIIDLTEKFESKEKFAFVNISRSAINAILPEAEKKPPKHFVNSILKCIEIDDPNFLKAVPYEFSSDIENGKYSNLGLVRENNYYDANMFDHYFSTRREVVDIFINHYIRDSKNVVLSFHDKKTVQKAFGANQYVITVPYNNYYDKLDSIVAQIAEFDGGVDACILDCPLLATAIAPKIWEKLNMSIIDFGRVVSSYRFLYNETEKPKTYKPKDKSYNNKRNEKR